MMLNELEELEKNVKDGQSNRKSDKLVIQDVTENEMEMEVDRNSSGGGMSFEQDGSQDEDLREEAKFTADDAYYQNPKLSIVHEEEYEESVRDSVLDAYNVPIDTGSEVDNMDLLDDDDQDYQDFM